MNKKVFFLAFLILLVSHANALTIKDNPDANNEIELSFASGQFQVSHNNGQSIERIVPCGTVAGIRRCLSDVVIPGFNQDSTLSRQGRNRFKWGFAFDSIAGLTEIGFDVNINSQIVRIDSNSSEAKIITTDFIFDFSDIQQAGFTVAISQSRNNRARVSVTGLPGAGRVVLDPLVIKTGGANTDLSEMSHYGLVKDGNFFAAAWISSTSGSGDGNVSFSRSINGGTVWSADYNLSAPFMGTGTARMFDMKIDRTNKKLHLIFNTNQTPPANGVHYYYLTCNYNFDTNCSALNHWAGFDLNFIVPSNNFTSGAVVSDMGLDFNTTGSLFVALFTRTDPTDNNVSLIHADGNTQVKANWVSDSNFLFTSIANDFNPGTGLDLIITNDLNVNIIADVNSSSTAGLRKEFLRYTLWDARTRTTLIKDQNTTDPCRLGNAQRCFYVGVDKKSNGDLIVLTSDNTNGQLLRYQRATNTWLSPVSVSNTGRASNFTVLPNDDIIITATNPNIGYMRFYDSNQTLSSFVQVEAQAPACCSKISNWDGNNSLEMTYISSTGDVNFTRIVFPLGASFALFQIKTVEGIDVSSGTFPTFSQVKDGNLTIGFSVFSDVNNLLVDLNFSTLTTNGTGTVIINDLNLNANFARCASLNFTAPVLCTWDFNIAPQFVLSDGNYYGNGILSNGINTSFDASDKNFLIDNTPPVLVDLNFTAETPGFSLSDLNGAFIIVCNDNNSTIVKNVISRNDANILDVNAARNTPQSVDGNASNGAIIVKGYCFDAGRNSDSNSFQLAIHAIQFILIDEETGLDYNVFKADAVRAIRFDNNSVFDFQQNNTNKVFYVSTTDDYLRFDFNYTTALIERDFNVATLTDGNVFKVCGVKRGATFFTQQMVSILPKQAVLISDLYDCYVTSDNTKFTNNELRSLVAYTITTSYRLYTIIDGMLTQIALVDGGSSHTINMDTLIFNNEQSVFSIADQALSLDINSATGLINVRYQNVADDSNSVTINIYDGVSSSILFSTTNNTTPNDFTATFTVSSLEDLNQNVYKVEAVVAKNSGRTERIIRYFSTSGFEDSILNPVFAAILSAAFFIFAISIVRPQYAFTWFGLLITGICIIITALAPSVWYLSLLQAVYVIFGMYIGFTYGKQNIEVT